MATENKVSGIASWTPEQEAKIAEYQEKGGLSRGEAVRKLHNEELKAKVAKRAEAKPKAEPKPKAAKAPKMRKEKVVKVSKGDAKHYDQQAVIDGFLKHGKTISELADAQKMSHVYCHRILTTKVPKEYAVEQARRAEAREKAKAKAAKS
jgi:hypothetical protein